jgi:hypothetical protein
MFLEDVINEAKIVMNQPPKRIGFLCFKLLRWQQRRGLKDRWIGYDGSSHAQYEGLCKSSINAMFDSSVCDYGIVYAESSLSTTRKAFSRGDWSYWPIWNKDKGSWITKANSESRASMMLWFNRIFDDDSFGYDARRYIRWGVMQLYNYS